MIWDINAAIWIFRGATFIMGSLIYNKLSNLTDTKTSKLNPAQKAKEAFLMGHPDGKLSLIFGKNKRIPITSLPFEYKISIKKPGTYKIEVMHDE